MSAAVIKLQPQPRPAGSPADFCEPLDAAVREVGARLSENHDRHLRLSARRDELRTGDPKLRRKGERPRPDPSRPLTIFSIEEAENAGPREAAVTL